MTRWFEETDSDDYRVKLKADRVLYESETEHQHLVLFENPTFGRVLMLDGIIQTTENDEFVYHEMLAHLPILAHGRARRVLIVGGGDGGMAEEVLKHRSVESLTMVEIDGSVIDFSKQYLGAICGRAFDDPRLELVIADGFEYVADCAARYDVIIVDSTDPVGPGKILFTEEFYRRCHGALTEGGVLVGQLSLPYVFPEVLRDAMARLRPNFADATCYLATVPTYTGGETAVAWASDNPALREVPLETLRQRFAAAALETRYYTPEVHRAAFALPAFVRDLTS